jgi:hypothetical protein
LLDTRKIRDCETAAQTGITGRIAKWPQTRANALPPRYRTNHAIRSESDCAESAMTKKISLGHGIAFWITNSTMSTSEIWQENFREIFLEMLPLPQSDGSMREID